MKKFILKTFSFTIIISALFLVTIVLKNKSNGSDYMKGLKIKHDLIGTIKTPKLILAGGSNLAFGIDSKEISDSLGIRVMNMGLHAGLGTDFILADTKSCMKEGDAVIFSIEYFLDKEGQYDLILNAEKYYPEVKNFLPQGLGFTANAYLQVSKKEVRKLLFVPDTEQKEDSVHTSKAFNQYGDVVSHLNQSHHRNLGGKTTFQYHYWETIEDLNKFIEYANNKKVKVFYLFPCYPESDFEINKIAIKKLEEDLRKNLACDILTRPEDFVYADSAFFDTVYHLGKAGREKRTKQLITLLSQNADFQRTLSSLKVCRNTLTSN